MHAHAFLKAGVRLDIQVEDGMTPLHMARKNCRHYSTMLSPICGESAHLMKSSRFSGAIMMQCVPGACGRCQMITGLASSGRG